MQVSAQAAQSMEVASAVSPGGTCRPHRGAHQRENLSVPSVEIDGRTVITTGNWLKIAAFHDEDLVEGDTVADPAFISFRI